MKRKRKDHPDNPVEQPQPTPAKKRSPRGGVSKELVEHREREAWRGVLQGEKKRKIAQRLGVDEKTIRNIIERINKREAAQFNSEIHELRAAHYERMEIIIEQAEAAFQKTGEPRLLKIKIEASKRQCEILAVDAPKQTELKMTGEVALPGAFPTRDELQAQIQERLAALKPRS